MSDTIWAGRTLGIVLCGLSWIGITLGIYWFAQGIVHRLALRFCLALILSFFSILAACHGAKLILGMP